MKENVLESLVALGIVVLAIALIGGFVYFGFSTPAENDAQVFFVEKDNDPGLGSLDAPVTVIEFSDFSCTFCAKFSQEVKPLIEAYAANGTIRFVYRDFPLTSIHPKAMQIAQAAGCVDEQSEEAFWEFHDVVYANLDAQEIGQLRGYAQDTGINISEYDSCFASERRVIEIQKDMYAGRQVGVTGTPTFFFNGRKHTGYLFAQAFAQKVEEALALERDAST